LGIEITEKELPLACSILHEQGLSIRRIAALLGIGHMRVYRMLKKVRGE
jgi:transposase-like protein